MIIIKDRRLREIVIKKTAKHGVMLHVYENLGDIIFDGVFHSVREAYYIGYHALRLAERNWGK